jgi:hypothetical protein
MECKGQIEIDDYCTKNLEKHWPHVPKWRDIKTVDPAELPAADLICGGYPCQPFSQAGQRRGAEDGRHLWPFIVPIITKVKPAWCLFENIAGHMPSIPHIAETEFGLLPTPVACDWKNSTLPPAAAKRYNLPGYLLRTMMFPTPSTGAGLCGGTGSFQQLQKLKEAGVITEEERKAMSHGRGGQLNPEFVEWLMGFPIGWTELNA